jgi:hypothetical protein
MPLSIAPVAVPPEDTSCQPPLSIVVLLVLPPFLTVCSPPVPTEILSVVPRTRSACPNVTVVLESVVVTEVALTALIAVANGKVGFPRNPTAIGTTSNDTPGLRSARVKLYVVPLRTACSWVLPDRVAVSVTPKATGEKLTGVASK